MDSSQSSNVFSGSIANISFASVSNNVDFKPYDCLLNNIKTLLCDTSSITDSTFSITFTSLLEDCHTYISQSINLVTVMLMDTDTAVHKLSAHMEDAVSILQLLSSYIKHIVETAAMPCCNMNTFPTTTGQIIMDVFTHCKNSETIYGLYLTSVKKQLKDLFRSCHELQLTYLMVLEKNFIFDLTETKELDILVEALYINLHIGDIVQSLDVKTMAEQWKGYTVICEKYSVSLSETRVYQESSKLLCSMILSNIQQVIEGDLEEKLVLRSMKVTTFTIKILIKVFNIFKNSTNKPYSSIVDLLINVYMHSPAYLETAKEKSDQFISIMNNNVLKPTDQLLKELIGDEEFKNVILDYNVNKFKEDDRILGFAMLIVNVIKNITELQESKSSCKVKLVNCIFNLLPECYVWCNLGLKYKMDNQSKPVGLFEYFLIHCAGLALTMTAKEMSSLEKILLEVLLGTDSWSALFASNLWIIIARLSRNNIFVYSQLTSLCHIYLKLENVTMFRHSPQRVHLSYTISELFELITDLEREKICKRFNPITYPTLWKCIKVTNLPIGAQRSVEECITHRFKIELQKLTSFSNDASFADLINITNLISTCSLNALDTLEDCLIELWLKSCPKNLKFLTQSLDMSAVWYLEFLEALVSLTFAMKYAVYEKSSSVTKILHVISNITQLGNVQLNLLIIDLLCDLASTPIYDDNKTTAVNIVKESFKNLVYCNESIVRTNFFNAVKCSGNKYLEQTVSSIVNGDPIEEIWQHFVRKNNSQQNYTKLKEQLTVLTNFHYQHKCIEQTHENEYFDKAQRSCNSNFDLADIDSLFDNESETEPASKKVKLDNSKTDEILNRLEQEVTVLCSNKENLFTDEHKKKIHTICEKLKDIIS